MTKPWCTCGTNEGWSHAGDQVWVHPLCGKQSRLAWESRVGMEDPKLYFGLPPRGLSVSTSSKGGYKENHYTYFCDANEECYAVAYGNTEKSAREQLDGHVCPAPARRSAHPSGRTVVQKAWDELDDAIDVIKQGPEADYLGMSGDILKGYAQGIAEVLAYLAIPYFRFAEDILKQANRRWKMRQKLIPFESTPGYNFYPAQPLDYIKAYPETKQAGGKPAKRAPIKATKTAAPAAKQLSTEDLNIIRESFHSGVPDVDLAKMFGISTERVRTIAGSANSAPVELPPIPMML